MKYMNETADVVVLEVEDAVMEIGPGADIWIEEDASPYHDAPNFSLLTQVAE